MRAHQSSALATILLFAAAISACSDSTTQQATRTPVAAIRFSPDNPTVDVGHATQVIATPVDKNGAALTGRTVSWSVPVGALVSVSATGGITGLTPGVDTVFASIEGITQPLVVTVSATTLSISVSPPAATFVYGSNVQLTAALRNQFGEALAGTITWSSETPTIATVNASGLVVGVSLGQAIIRASFGSLVKLVPVMVTLDSLAPASNATFSGVRDFAAVAIKSGTTLTVSGAATIRSFGPVTIDGTITTNGAACTAVSIESRSTVTITGTVDLPCGLRVVGSGGLSVHGAVIRTIGRQFFTNDTTLVDANSFTLSASNGPLGCDFNAATMTIGTGTSTSGAAPWEVACRGDITFTGPTLAQAQDGVVGTESFNRAGTVRVRATRDIITTSGTVVLATGNGGPGITSIVDGSQQALLTIARGGVGGSIGSSNTPSAIVRATRDFVLPSGEGSLTLRIGNGGEGGTAAATGFTGINAAATTAAQDGGEALAIAGAGGTVYAPDVSAGRSTVGGIVRITGGNGGAGGQAFATGGRAGDGSESFPHGGIGGAFTAWGGDGGSILLHVSPGEQARAGDGGLASVSGGTGGNGWSACALPSAQHGGSGGRGGTGQAKPGVGGSIFLEDGSIRGTNGIARFSDVGNGGNGGNGLFPGLGGLGGDEIPAQTASARTTIGRVFLEGVVGSPCP